MQAGDSRNQLSTQLCKVNCVFLLKRRVRKCCL